MSKGTLFHEMHRFAALALPAYEDLKQLFRQAEVKYADETPWRTDGNNGYAWLFIGGPVRLFVCAGTRAMSVPADVLADNTGALMTDRYPGYNCFLGRRIYCFEHLKRDTQKIVLDNPKSRECITFADRLVPLLAEAMSLRTACSGDPVTTFVKAASIRYKIEQIVAAPARHPSVQHIQNIFRENSARMWPWTEDPRIPCENNTAERGVRPLAIARKVSHGSQSVLMSILHTLSALCIDPAARLKVALDRYAQNPGTDVYAELFRGLLLHAPIK